MNPNKNTKAGWELSLEGEIKKKLTWTNETTKEVKLLRDTMEQK